MAVPKAEIYSRKMRRLMRALDRESEKAVRASLRLLDETRARLSRQLTELGERGWAKPTAPSSFAVSPTMRATRSIRSCVVRYSLKSRE